MPVTPTVEGLTEAEWQERFEAHLQRLGITLYGQARLVGVESSRKAAASELASTLFGAAFDADPKKSVQVESIRQRDANPFD